METSSGKEALKHFFTRGIGTGRLEESSADACLDERKKKNIKTDFYIQLNQYSESYSTLIDLSLKPKKKFIFSFKMHNKIKQGNLSYIIIYFYLHFAHFS